LSEDLGVFILSSFCAVAPVPRQQDVGIDVICTLLRPGDGRALYAEESFYVQIKSKSVDQITFVDDQYKWFRGLQLPYFVARVDRASLTVELYSPVSTRHHFIESDYRGIAFSFGQLDASVPIEREGVRQSTFGRPVAAIKVEDIDDVAKLTRYYEIIKAIARVEEENRQLLRVRSVKQIKWSTNEVPRSDGQMSLVNVGYENYEREVYEALMEMIRSSSLAFTRNTDALLPILPLISQAEAKGVLTPDDRKLLGLMVTVAMHKDRVPPAPPPPIEPPAGGPDTAE
jgi:hypothetical protein